MPTDAAPAPSEKRDAPMGQVVKLGPEGSPHGGKKDPQKPRGSGDGGLHLSPATLGVVSVVAVVVLVLGILLFGRGNGPRRAGLPKDFRPPVPGPPGGFPVAAPPGGGPGGRPPVPTPP